MMEVVDACVKVFLEYNGAADAYTIGDDNDSYGDVVAVLSITVVGSGD